MSYNNNKPLQKTINEIIETSQSNIHDIHVDISKFQLFQKTDHISKVSDNVFYDLEFFESNNLDSNTIIDEFKTFTHFNETSTFLKYILKHPIIDTTSLLERKNYIINFTDIYHNETQNIDDIFNSLKVKLKSAYWLVNNYNEEFENMLNIIYFHSRFLNKLNSSEYLLTSTNVYNMILSPVIGILSPFIYYIIPFIIIKYKFKLNISFFQYLKFSYSSISSSKLIFDSTTSNIKYLLLLSYCVSFFVYFHGVWNSLQVSRNTFNISSFIISKINDLSDIIILENKLTNIIDVTKNPFIKIPTTHNINHVSNSIFTFGKQLKYFKNIDRNNIKLFLNKIYLFDSLLAIIKTQSHLSLNLCNYNDNYDILKPFVSMIQFDHINLSKLPNCVKNNFNIGTDNFPSNSIITGPNAAGKSTFIKAFYINVILSQTICMGSYQSLCFTPFKYFNTQITIPDCKGVASLFEAEMYRSKQTIEDIKALKSTEFALITMDELFNSTNVVEGISGAYAILHHLSKFHNLINIVTTHFVYLTKLKKTGLFSLYKMNATISDDDIHYSYLLSNGVSRQTIALEILKINNFGDEIINEAMEIKNKILHKTY